MSLLPVEHWCTFFVAIIPHTDFVWMTEWMRCVRIVRWIFVKCLVEVIISVVLCVGTLASRNPTQFCLSCCPGAAFHVNCMATVVPSGHELISCPMCPESVRDHVSVEWFQRLCHISGVQWPQLQAFSSSRSSALSVLIFMSDDTSVQVPCCQQHLHINCLVRSFTSCGFHCPFCNQCLSDFARSGSFQASDDSPRLHD